MAARIQVPKTVKKPVDTTAGLIVDTIALAQADQLANDVVSAMTHAGSFDDIQLYERYVRIGKYM
jgi:hypothetical protein